MCFDLDSRPPIAPIAGGALDRDVADAHGRRWQPLPGVPGARHATERGRRSSILPDVRGLHPYYEELALRFAEAGIDAVAIDYFGRTAGLDTPARRRLRVRAARRADDVGRASPPTSGRPPPSSGRTGRGSARCSRSGSAWAAGGVRGPDARPRAGRRDRLLRLAGPRPRQRHADPGRGRGRDGGRGPRPVRRRRRRASRPRRSREFEDALTAAGVDHRLVTYDGAPHSFFDRKAAEFADASDAAWGEVLAFIAAEDRGIDGGPSGPGLTTRPPALRGATTRTRPGRSMSAAAAKNAPRSG